MRVPLTEVGRCGRLDLVFGRRGDQTFLRDSYCEVPFKITRTLSAAGDGVAHLMLMHCTAGLFGGDSMEMTVHVERGARVRLTQQSATRVHPSEDRWAIQSNRIYVESGGELDLLFEPIIPFAASRLRQTTSIDLERGGRLLFWEGLMAGRVGSGEVWEFKDLSYETRLTSEARLLFLDRFHLRPERSSPASDWRMGKATYAGTGLYVGSDPGKFAEGLHTALPMAGVDALSDDLAVTRVVTCHGPEFHRWREVFARNRPAR
jgi:urease accessory protein UreH